MPTRRSARTSPTPVQAPVETPSAASRAQSRRANTAERPPVIWSRETPQTDAEAVVDAEPQAPAPGPAVVELDTTVIDAPAVVAPAQTRASGRPRTQAMGETPSRRARRAVQTTETPVIAVPPIAPVAPAEPERAVPAFHVDATPVVVQPVSETAQPLDEPRSASTFGEHAVFSEPAAITASQPVAEAAEASAAPDIDAFAAAARLFEFTREHPVALADDADVVEVTPEAEATTTPANEVAHAPTRRSRAALKRAATASFSIGVMGLVGILAVGLTTPIEAVASTDTAANPAVSLVAAGDVEGIDEDEVQAYIAPAEAVSDSVQRSENYSIESMADIASESGITNFSNFYTNDPNAAIQWPFAVGVSISWGFGMRSGRLHEGLDFVPGNGATVQAVADGTVRVASESGGAYGVHVIIDHIIDGKLVSSHYAHMQYGSLQVTPGEQVHVGQMLGRTGNTGRSFGAHTHFEILQNGTTAIDPLPWLRANTGRSSLG